MTRMPLTERPAWRALAALAARGQPHLRELLHEPGRGDYARLAAAGIELDFTRQRIDRTLYDALLALAREAGVEAQRDAMLAGAPVNATEGRAVLHVALRGGAEAEPPWSRWTRRTRRLGRSRPLPNHQASAPIRRGWVTGGGRFFRGRPVPRGPDRCWRTVHQECGPRDRLACQPADRQARSGSLGSPTRDFGH
jgi:glucose-6-phosphate isomerase